MEGEGTQGEYTVFVRQPNADWLTRRAGGNKVFLHKSSLQIALFIFFRSLKINQFLRYKKLFFLLSAHTSFVGLSVSHFLLVLVGSGWALCVSALH